MTEGRLEGRGKQFTLRVARLFEFFQSLTRLLRAIPCRYFEASNQHEVHDLVIVGLVVAINEHFKPAGRQGHEIFMLHKQTPTVGHMNSERPKRSVMQQLPDFIGFHRSENNSAIANRQSQI